MNISLYLRISAIIFFIVFALHLLRVIYGVEVVIAGWSVPLWLSWVAVLGSAFFSAYGFRLSSQK